MKICIVGPSGAGKTTLSHQLAKKLNISAYAFDEIYWNLNGTDFIKNSEEFISNGVKKISIQDRWIVEGAYDKRLLPLLLECSLILKMEVPFYLRTIRLLQRYLSSVVIDKEPKETLKNTLELIQFSHSFDKRLEKFLCSNAQLSKKTIPFNNFSKAINIIQTFFKNN
ncbi:AAA family ATPase [Acinetobacter baumannii]|uniref:AAA family ATPase n=1 Tax=Acinetobacter baumannii TaxID=470 RepID=UPI001EF08561|nr:AAA family ATPase [Acinetobacter baumannii]MCG6642829.1 AAA family ATPase [Acinetobacter baumannii]MDC4443128.1 AAA family ATPase [Acinetobacter baumannii]MDC4653579.1 AAA family ATPase [Acinetobacter baumannii]MDH2505098.1 AAA family ATPase [Acinetobacter baumannii]MDN8189033.1 AAA family ATPase [Acinetobacter baumannii]